jgi:protein O-mannosyl-transferase
MAYFLRPATAPLAASVSHPIGTMNAFETSAPRRILVSSAERSSLRGMLGIVALLAVIVPLAALSPALWNGFVWDDEFNLVTNRSYRGLGWAQLQWMSRTTLLSHWIPVTWVTFGLDYVMWQMNAAGYHLSNLLLHAANAWLFLLVARRLVRLAAPATAAIAVLSGATAASLFFSVHPLRVESVAWITERRDVLSGFFFLASVLAYLRGQDRQHVRGRRWLAISIACFQLGVLSKSIVVTLPLVLLILDVYPLRRVEWSSARWFTRDSRHVFLEKLPFVPLTVIGSVVATSIIGRANEFTPLSLVERLTLAVHSFWFYVWKTAVPVGLSPLYELPDNIDPRQPRFAAAALAVLGLTVLAALLARRWPAMFSAWLTYLVIVGPVSGITHTGIQIAADRYTYLSCLPWALLVGGGVTAIVQAHLVGALPTHAFRRISIALGSWLLALALITSHQTLFWRDSETLWRRALALDPRCFACHHNVGSALLHRGMNAAAIEHFERAIAIRPPAPLARGGLVFAHVASGAPDEARRQLEILRLSDRQLARDLSGLLVMEW